MRRESSLQFKGRVSNGFGEGAAFVKLDGYKKQFIDVLGYEPYPGTLNIELSDDGQNSMEEMSDIDPLVVEGWSDGETDYGPVYCYPATLQTGNESESVHIIRPERTRHEEAILEVLSRHNLRNRIDLDTGDSVTVVIEPDLKH